MSSEGCSNTTDADQSLYGGVLEDVYADAGVVFAASEEGRLFPLRQTRPDRLWILGSKPVYYPERTGVTNALLADCELNLLTQNYVGALTSYSLLSYYFDYFTEQTQDSVKNVIGAFSEDDILKLSLLDAQRNIYGNATVEHETSALRVLHCAARREQLTEEKVNYLLQIYKEDGLYSNDISDIFSWVQTVAFSLDHILRRRDEVACESVEVMQEHDAALLSVRSDVVAKGASLTGFDPMQIEQMLESRFKGTFTGSARRLVAPSKHRESPQLTFPGASIWGIEVRGS